MRKLLSIFALATITVFQCAYAYGQAATTSAATSPAQSKADAGVTANGVIGEVTAIDPKAMQMMVKTDTGSAITVTLNSNTNYMRLAPGEKTLKNAAKITLADVGVGDRVWARGKTSEDQRSVPAIALIVMTRADIAQKQERDRVEWQKRGVTGRVTAVNPAGQEITVSVRAGREGERPLMIVPASDARFRRYAPDSVKFSDAKSSTFAELKVGDQLRALGERSADGARYTAEEIVTGSFRMVGGPIIEVNAGAGEVKINNLQTGQPLTVVVGRDSILRRLPPMMAERLAQRAGAGGDGPNAAAGAPDGDGPRRRRQQEGNEGGGGSGARPAGTGEGGGPRQRTGAGAPDFQEMFDNLPAITVAELKKGDAIIVSSTTGVDPTRVTAIRLAAGVEPILNRPQPQAQPGRQAPAPSLALPGLDTGIGLP